MAKDDAATKGQATEIDEILKDGKKKPLNFALMKAKEGVVLKAHPLKSADAMLRDAKAAGGMPAVSCQGVLNVVGKIMELTVEVEDAPRTLPKLAKKHFANLGVQCKVVMKLPGGVTIDGDAEDEGAPVEMKTVAPGVEAPVSPETSGLRDSLAKEFSELSDGLRKFLEQAEAGIGGKARQVMGLFRAELDGDLRKAAAALSMLRKMVQGTPAPKGDGTGTAPTGPTSGGVIADIGTKIGEVVDKVADVLSDTVEDLTTPPEEKAARDALDLLGLSRDERDQAMEDLKKDPQAIDKIKKTKMTEAGVPEDRQAALLKLSQSNPKAFAEALKSLGAMEKDGKIDTSPAEMQKALEAMEASRKEAEARRKDLDKAAKALADQLKIYGEASGRVAAAQGAADKAAQDILDLKARVGDVTRLTNEQKLAFATESRKLMSANETAKANLEKAIEAEKQASMDYAKASDTNRKAGEASDQADAKAAAARKANDAKEGKKALLDATTFGPLSASGKMSDEDKARFAQAFGKNAKVANGALGVAATAKDPGTVARNVGMIADKANDGFADAKGNAPDLPEDDRLKMAENALRMGGEMGDGYFKGFEDYLKTGKQLQPDPQGGLEGPLADAKAEEKRKNKVALDRTRALGTAALKDDGTVDFDSDKARAAMDHMMFHPGSLKTFTPQMNQKMAETKALFADPATKDRAQQTIKDTKLPPTGAAGKVAATTIVGGTMGKDKGSVTDADAKASVLSAMMTPLSQGPVGSCFSTAPVHAIRETDPLRAMGEYAKIATTGQFKDKAGDIYPANTHLPEGENPLMRSWEYSVATAAAEKQGSIERKGLKDGLFGSYPPNKNFNAVKDIVGNAAWADSNDPVSGDLVPGVKSKLKQAMSSELKFEYNAGPQVGGPGGGGDGHSTDGAYEILYKGKALTTEADFIAAMKEIALAATGETEATPKGQQIVTLVTSADFKKTILASGGSEDYLPWKLSGGGYEKQTAKALDGGTPSNQDVLGKNNGTPPKDQTARTTEILTSLLTAQQGMTKDLAPLGTTGKNANHAFNTLPKDPSLDKIKDPGSADKIKRELVDPGVKIATTKLPAAQAAKLFEDQLRAQMEGKSDSDRDLVVAALKNRPTTDMTPSEVQAKVARELRALRDVLAQRNLDAWFIEENKRLKAKGKPEMPARDKAGYLDWFKTDAEDGFKNAVTAQMAKELAVPEVVVADSNWGGPEGQTYFVAAPDPITGNLMMWKKDMPGGKLTPLGKNWEDAKWDTVK